MSREIQVPDGDTPAPPVGRLLRHWRRVRHQSQLALALEAGVSARHLSFVETGRARPSREMVLTLARTLEVPLREQNELLLAAGFAPAYRESDLDGPEMTAARRALDHILRHQEPHPAVVMDRHWNLLRTNGGAARLFGLFLDLEALPSPVNVLRLIFDPEGLRRFVVRWEELAPALLQRLHREALGGVLDEDAEDLLAELLARPGVPARWRTPDLAAPPSPFVPVELDAGDGRRFRYFSTVTTLGTPRDVTLQEVRLECFFPADEATVALAEALAADEL